MPGFTLGFCFYGVILSAVLSLQAPLSAGPFLKISNNLSDVANAATSRSNLGLVIGTNVQAQDAELEAIAGLVSAADQLPYFTGSGTASLTTLTAYARTLLDDANEAAARSTLGLVAGGAGDIWVEKAGDTMLGKLNIELTSAQLRLAYETGVKFVDFSVDTNHSLTIKPSSTGQVIFQPTTDSTNFLQVLNASGGGPVVNIDTTNERFGIGIATPEDTVAIVLGTAGGILSSSVITDATTKDARFLLRHYTNAEEAVAFFGSASFAAATEVRFGGGFGVNNAATIVKLFTAANNTTLTGTERLRIVSSGRVSIGSTTSPAQLFVDQASTTAAIPVLSLDQADVSEEMIEFITTIGVGNAIEAVGAKTLTTTHFVKCTIPGGLTRYWPIGTIA